MKPIKPPVPVIIVGWFFIVAGTIGFIYHLKELDITNLFSNDAVWVLVIRLLAVVGGILVLRGQNVGRWLLVLWLSYHVVLSVFHTVPELIVHVMFLAIVIFTLFHSKVAPYFRRKKTNLNSADQVMP